MSVERWNSDQVVRKVKKQADRGLEAAGRSLARDLTQTLSVFGQGRPAPVGQPPRRQSGALLRAVGVQRVPGGGVRVGITDPGQQAKAATLAKRRPYLAPTVRRSSQRLLGDFVRGAK
ncbi:MAG TPA: hypothetical protein VGR26_15030 [Acidimicrobiales bacterium]|nr:hypothetical protein [Acidimicrobiales bacterium]